MRQHLLAWISVLLLVACEKPPAGPPDVEAGTIVIAQHLPPGWTLANRIEGQLPEGHYWGDWGRDYKGPRGRQLILVGPRRVELSWRDNAGVWRHEPLAKESLEIWLMPADYSEGFWSRVNPHASPPARLVFSGAMLKVYAVPSHRSDNEPR